MVEYWMLGIVLGTTGLYGGALKLLGAKFDTAFAIGAVFMMVTLVVFLAGLGLGFEEGIKP